MYDGCMLYEDIFWEQMLINQKDDIKIMYD